MRDQKRGWFCHCLLTFTRQLFHFTPDSLDSFGCFDFSTTSSTLNFAAGTVAGGIGSRLCVNVPINDDICCEALENFQVDASSTNPIVTFPSGTSSSVFITDNDSECQPCTVIS